MPSSAFVESMQQINNTQGSPEGQRRASQSSVRKEIMLACAASGRGRGVERNHSDPKACQLPAGFTSQDFMFYVRNRMANILAVASCPLQPAGRGVLIAPALEQPESPGLIPSLGRCGRCTSRYKPSDPLTLRFFFLFFPFSLSSLLLKLLLTLLFSFVAIPARQEVHLDWITSAVSPFSSSRAKLGEWGVGGGVLTTRRGGGQRATDSSEGMRG